MNPKFKNLENLTIKKFGSIELSEPLTDVIPKGVTIVYGASGSGKTYSVIKNLNRYNIEPLLIDFDNNTKLDNLSFALVDGKYFVNGFRQSVKKVVKNSLLIEAEEKLANFINTESKKIYTRMGDTNRESNDVHCWEDVAKDFTKYMHDALCDKEYDILENDVYQYSGIYKPTIDTSSNFIFKDEIVIIDTYVKAVDTFEDDEKIRNYERFEMFVNQLSKNNSVIIVCHSKRFLNTEVADCREEFVNHCNGRLHLNKSSTRTKNTEYWMVIEKHRGYKGNDIIKNWER